MTPQPAPKWHAVRTAFVALDPSDPLVAWLAYRAEIVSAGRAHPSSASFWLTRALRDHAAGQRKAAFADELELERRRALRYPDAVSRLRGFYAFENKAEAQAAIGEWEFTTHSVVEVAILEKSQISRHDAQWIALRLGESGPQRWMERYLAGEACPAARACWELVVEGRAIIFGTEAREQAYETVKRAWPRSLALLELARLGVELDSDLGLIVPMVSRTSDYLHVGYLMSEHDMSDKGFLRRLAAFSGPRNSADLNQQSVLVVPDLTGRGFQLPADTALLNEARQALRWHDHSEPLPYSSQARRPSPT
jgi:hypothetical protein